MCIGNGWFILISSPIENLDNLLSTMSTFVSKKQMRSWVKDWEKVEKSILLQHIISLLVTMYVTRHVPLHRSIDHSADQSPSLTVSIRSSPSLFPSCNSSLLESCIMFQFGSCIIDSSWRGLAHSLTLRVIRPRVRFRLSCHFGINHLRNALVKSIVSTSRYVPRSSIINMSKYKTIKMPSIYICSSGWKEDKKRGSIKYRKLMTIMI